MNKLIAFLLFVLLSCNHKNSINNSFDSVQRDSIKMDSCIVEFSNDSLRGEELEDEMMATFFVVLADTGKDYYTLRKKMFELNSVFNLPIDTMNRYFDKHKRQIVLSESDEDEMYRGEYFPRRDASDFLSIEYLNVYFEKADLKTLALVAGIFEEEKLANKVLELLKQKCKSGYVVKASLYEGCMH